MIRSRRDFIKKISLGTAFLSINSNNFLKNITEAPPISSKSTVSFAYGQDRRKLIYQILEPFEKKIRQDIKGKQIIIKPNCVWDGIELCATHSEAIRGVLDFLKPFYKETVVIAESTASPAGTMKCFEDYGYTKLPKEYDVKLIDFNQGTYSVEWILGKNRHPIDIKIIDTFLNPNNYIISLARMKTHDGVVCTLALKNMIMASPINVPKNNPDFVVNQYEKNKMHQGGTKGINYNIFLMAHKVKPKLAIIDGFVGMEGNGPNRGTPVEHNVALASFDVISVDRIGIELMGINYDDVGYLNWCSNDKLGQGDIQMIEVIGSDYKKHIKKYKLANNIEQQLKWKDKSES